MPDVKSTGPDRIYPALPADQVTGCRRASIPVGIDAKAAWARAEAAWAACDRLQRRGVRWYNDLRNTKGK